MPRSYRFHIHLSPEKYQTFYQGQAKNVRVTSDCGKRLQIPASNFRDYITAEGINGWFQLETDDNNKLLKLVRLD